MFNSQNTKVSCLHKEVLLQSSAPCHPQSPHWPLKYGPPSSAHPAQRCSKAPPGAPHVLCSQRPYSGRSRSPGPPPASEHTSADAHQALETINLVFICSLFFLSIVNDYISHWLDENDYLCHRRSLKQGCQSLLLGWRWTSCGKHLYFTVLMFLCKQTKNKIID